MSGKSSSMPSLRVGPCSIRKRGRLLPARWRGRIILSRDPDGLERCVACYLCAVACPVDCISLQTTEDEHGRRYPEFFRINFSRCIFCGYCEEACPTYAIQLTPDFEMGEWKRRQPRVRKGGPPHKRHRQVPGLQFLSRIGCGCWREGKGKEREGEKPVDVKDLLP